MALFARKAHHLLFPFSNAHTKQKDIYICGLRWCYTGDNTQGWVMYHCCTNINMRVKRSKIVVSLHKLHVCVFKVLVYVWMDTAPYVQLSNFSVTI